MIEMRGESGFAFGVGDMRRKLDLKTLRLTANAGNRE
jgi:hypothetical protein